MEETRLSSHAMGVVLFAELNRHLTEPGWVLSEGTIVDVSILDASTSTQNQRQARDPETHSTRKGNRWPCGMKLHIGVDPANGLAHSLQTTVEPVFGQVKQGLGFRRLLLRGLAQVHGE